ncbi:hypothetical protein [Pinibacter soli]|uniref:Transcriptional regulator n=1 Tax=Pinibacter soli TaxID=3044211 RepID=A0ABT6RB40_9BACT|nr:hypothetical protein [Pinibacter soli]MDI3319112.1 hypothetical protein [Pinibacter soli]
MERNMARFNVIEDAVSLEEIVSLILASLLGIEKDTSKSFGNTSQALSFNSKINLLTDLKSIEKDSAAKFVHFAQIRNQFAHNVYAINFVNCLADNESCKNFLKKNYKEFFDEHQQEEVQLEQMYHALFKDLMSILQRSYQLKLK